MSSLIMIETTIPCPFIPTIYRGMTRQYLNSLKIALREATGKDTVIGFIDADEPMFIVSKDDIEAVDKAIASLNQSLHYQDGKTHVRIMRYITQYIKDNDGISPSVNDIATALGLSTSSVTHHLRNLEKWGAIKRVPRTARSIVVIP